MTTTWQEKYARWVLKPKPPAKLNEKMSHWWFFLVMGFLFSMTICWATGKVSDAAFGFAAKHAGSDVAKEFSYAVTLGYYLFAFGAFMFFAVSGLIFEERKGYRRIIKKLEAKAEPGDTDNPDNPPENPKNQLDD